MWKHRTDVSSHHSALSALVCLTRFVLVLVQHGVSTNFTRASPAELNYFEAGPVHGIFAHVIPNEKKSRDTRGAEGTGNCLPAAGGKRKVSSRGTAWEKVSVCLPWNGNWTGRWEATWMTGRDGTTRILDGTGQDGIGERVGKSVESTVGKRRRECLGTRWGTGARDINERLKKKEMLLVPSPI